MLAIDCKRLIVQGALPTIGSDLRLVLDVTKWRIDRHVLCSIRQTLRHFSFDIVYILLSRQLPDTGKGCSGDQLFYERIATRWSIIRLAFTWVIFHCPLFKDGYKGKKIPQTSSWLLIWGSKFNILYFFDNVLNPGNYLLIS